MPEIPFDLVRLEGLQELHAQISALRGILDAFGRGDFLLDIRLRGAVAGHLKNLQAGLLHLCWQIQQVAAGDFSQRVEFMGEFSSSFNSMVEQLDLALATLRQKEAELTQLTMALQRELNQKAETLEALGKSETRFRYMAEHDLLTGVCNRRAFYDLAIMELEYAYRTDQSCVLVLFDIDHFKYFNDTYGHLEGDAALRHVTQTVAGGLREQDLLGRYGGEEFVLLLPSITKEDGSKTAERLRRLIADSPVETKSGPASITISMGLVFISPSAGKERNVSFLEEFIGYADNALYIAKESGRNTLVVFPCSKLK